MRSDKLYCLSLLLVLLVSCGSSSPVDSSVSPTIEADTTTSPPPLMVSSGTLTLVIYSPLNGSTVFESQVEVLGSVSTDSVLTLLGERHILTPGDFTVLVELEPGVNELHFTANSLLGNEVELTLQVTYQK